MGGTKGSHIVLDHPELLAATGGRELFFENADGRIVLIYPLKGRVLVGTTDLEHDMADPIVCTEAEVDYFIDLVRQVLPAITVDRSQIVYRFAGVRPLPGHGDVAPGFVSRDYRIEAEPLTGGDATVLSLVGGKWTTFRASAEHLADRALELLARPRRRSTKGVPIGGGRGYPITERARQQWIAGHAEELPLDRVAMLLDRYGTVATAVIDAIARRSRRHAAHPRSRVQHGRAAPPGAQRGRGASRRPPDAPHQPRVHRAGGSRGVGRDRRGDRAGARMGCRAHRGRGHARALARARRRPA